MGGSVNPGDRHGRVLPASAVDLAWDGNALSALVGPDLVEGVPGFGDSVHEALRELADRLIAEAVWVEIPEARRFDPAAAPPPFADGTIRTNVVNLYQTHDDRGCAVAYSEVAGAVVGVGDTAHDALRALADELAADGVWVEVDARTEWVIGTIAEGSADEVARATCPNCGVVNTFPGMSKIHLFTCSHCGADVRVPRTI